ncbi:MAG: hypothetical protein JKY17_08570 [Magnetovibrio sp.]|nr:hypothetical protein [Magnetovibrio sp.]
MTTDDQYPDLAKDGSPSVDPSGSTHSAMSIDDLRKHIHAVHDQSIGSEDPILMLYTIFHIFVDDYEDMLERHDKAITSSIGTAIKGLTADAITQNLQEQIRLADRTHQLFENQYKRMKVLSIVNMAIFFVCLLVFLYFVSK